MAKRLLNSKKAVEQQIHTLCIAFCGAHELERISVAEEKNQKSRRTLPWQ